MSGIMPDMDETAVHAQAEQDFYQRLVAATPRAYVTPLLIAANVVVFAAMAALGVNVLGARAEEYLHFGANFAPLTTGGQWWRLFTCTFIHFGIVHLAFNMWALWDSGRLTERLLGNAWFAVLYVFAGLAGSSASMLWNQNVISGGASGAVFGVYGALLAYMTAERGSIPPQTLNHLRVSTSTFVVYSLFYGFVQSGIDNAAHLGGLAGGFVMGLILARPLDQPRRAGGQARRAFLALSARGRHAAHRGVVHARHVARLPPGARVAEGNRSVQRRGKTTAGRVYGDRRAITREKARCRRRTCATADPHPAGMGRRGRAACARGSRCQGAGSPGLRTSAALRDRAPRRHARGRRLSRDQQSGV